MTLKAYLDASGYLLLSQTVKVYPPWSQPLLIDDLSAVFYNEHQALGNEWSRGTNWAMALCWKALLFKNRRLLSCLNFTERCCVYLQRDRRSGLGVPWSRFLGIIWQIKKSSWTQIKGAQRQQRRLFSRHRSFYENIWFHNGCIEKPIWGIHWGSDRQSDYQREIDSNVVIAHESVCSSAGSSRCYWP